MPVTSFLWTMPITKDALLLTFKDVDSHVKGDHSAIPNSHHMGISAFLIEISLVRNAD
jgi:hypothetical protein